MSVWAPAGRDLGCGVVGASAGATTLFARFDATGAVIYSRVVQLASGSKLLGPVVDGLGGISVAVDLGNLPSILVSRFAP